MRVGRWFTLLISDEDINDIIEIIKSLEDSAVFNGWVIEIVKQEINFFNKLN